jgi:hypothetical protein
VATIGLKVTGLREMVRDLEAVGVEVEDLKDAFGAIAKEGAEVGASKVHSRSGKLAGSTRGNRAKAKAVVTWGRAAVPYAGVQNYGWPRRNIPAQGFAQQTDQVMSPVAVAKLEENIERVITERGLR